MPRMLQYAALGLIALALAGTAFAADPSWPKELTFALLSTESALEVGRRWTPILNQLGKDLGISIKQVASTDYRGSIEALRLNKAQIGQLGPKGYIEASDNNYANVEPIVQLQHANGLLGYRSSLIVHPDLQQMVREGKVPRGAVRVIWVSKLIPNDPIVVRKDLPESLKQAIQQALVTMNTRHLEAFAEGGAWIGGFVKVDDAKFQIIRDLNETTKRLAALK